MGPPQRGQGSEETSPVTAPWGVLSLKARWDRSTLKGRLARKMEGFEDQVLTLTHPVSVGWVRKKGEMGTISGFGTLLKAPGISARGLFS